jgi:hypothetical protein
MNTNYHAIYRTDTQELVGAIIGSIILAVTFLASNHDQEYRTRPIRETELHEIERKISTIKLT